SRRRCRLRRLRRSGMHGSARRQAAPFTRGFNERVDPMTGDISPLRLFLEASLFVQVIIVLLMLASVASWAVIIDKARVLKRAMLAAQEFETSFWSGVDLSSLYRDMARAESTP